MQEKQFLDLHFFSAIKQSLAPSIFLYLTIFLSNPTPVKDQLLQNMIWPKVDPNQPENIQYLNINATLEVRSNPRYYHQVKKVYDTYITSSCIV